MSANLNQQIEELKTENQQLRQQLEQKTKVAARALASYQQQALHMEIIRQQNEDLDKLTTDLTQAKQLAEEHSHNNEAIAQKLAQANATLEKEVAERQLAGTEREKLLNEVRRLAAIVESHPDFIGVGTLDGQVLYVNPAGLKMMGQPLDCDVTKMKIDDFYPATDTEQFVQESIPTALLEGTWSGTANLLTVNRTTVPVEQTIAINYDAEGRPNSFSVTMRDITERQKVEAEREKLLADVQAAYNQYLRQGWDQYLNKRHQGELEVVHHRRIVDEGYDQVHNLSTFESEISLRGQRLGVLNLEDVDPNRRWTDEEKALVETVAEQLAQTAENLRLFDETRQQADFERLASEITQKLRQAPDLETLVEVAAQELGGALNVPFSVVNLGLESQRPERSEIHVHSENKNSV